MDKTYNSKACGYKVELLVLFSVSTKKYLSILPNHCSSAWGNGLLVEMILSQFFFRLDPVLVSTSGCISLLLSDMNFGSRVHIQAMCIAHQCTRVLTSSLSRPQTVFAMFSQILFYLLLFLVDHTTQCPFPLFLYCYFVN